MTLEVLTAPEAATRAKVARTKIDAACASGALRAADATPDSSKHAWRIDADDLRDWLHAGMPATPAATDAA